jgi:hypothetical protein
VPNLKRASGSITSSRAKGHLFIHEGRISVAVRTTCTLDLPVFSLVVLADGVELSKSRGMDPLDDMEWWPKKHGASETWPLPPTRSTAVSTFTFRISALLEVWSRQWFRMLWEFQVEIDVEVRAQSVMLPSIT